ncbi:MAG: MiaB/RimO family radical SAM methylthiotransferase [Longimicrobiales bacterium]
MSVSRRVGLPVLPHAVLSAPDPGSGAISLSATDGPRIAVVTLGCDKNTVDTERILARLAGHGARLARDANDAEVVLINTCGFIDAAREESVDTILDAVRLKGEGKLRAVVAMGCLVQRYRDELVKEIPEVDLFLGLTEIERLVPELRARGLIDDVPANMARPLRLLSTSTRHTSYLKVSEGCDHGCAFCAIPLMRGKHRSTPIDVLIQEARELATAGVVELNLVSQDTTWYGRDMVRGEDPFPAEYFIGRPFTAMAGAATAPSRWQPRPSVRRPHTPGTARPSPDSAMADAWQHGTLQARGRSGARHGLLPDLLQTLLDETDVPWFRLFYMYPSGIGRDLVDLMAAQPRIVPYLDMPIQHGADTVLARMRRPERQATIRERVRWLRSSIPDVALRTTVIVGFPGETDAEFEAMLDLLEEIRFDQLGAFPYSVEENTPAATFADHVDTSVIRERLERLVDVQRTISLERNEARIGRVETVLIDRLEGRDMDDPDAPHDVRGAVGRTARQALEVDGVVHIADAHGARAGEFIAVRITGALEDDLIGERVRAVR